MRSFLIKFYLSDNEFNCVVKSKKREEVKIKKNYYEILGVSPQVDQNGLKKAYRKMTLKYHPDRNKDDIKAEEKFKMIIKAYYTLSSKRTREKYDLLLAKKAKQKKSKENEKFFRSGEIKDDILKQQFEKYFGFEPNARRKSQGAKQNNDQNINTGDLFNRYFTGNKNKK